MDGSGKTTTDADGAQSDIARPRLTPQNRTDAEPSGEDSTDPRGGAKKGQPDKAEGE